jgi:hypothetical protein
LSFAAGARAAMAVATALLLPGTVRTAHAQHTPWVQLDLGGLFLHDRVTTRFNGTSSHSSADIGAGIALGIPLTRWLVPDASFHSSVGRDLAYHSLSIGLAARTTNDRRAYGHVALVRIFASQGDTCGGTCAAPNGNDQRWGFEFRAGLNLIDPEQFTLGPTIWYQQSLSPTGILLASYKAFGIGLQVGFN